MSYTSRAIFLELRKKYELPKGREASKELEILEKIGYYCKYEKPNIILIDTMVTENGGDLPALATEYIAYKREGYEAMAMTFQDYASDDISEEEEKGIREAYDYFSE